MEYVKVVKEIEFTINDLNPSLWRKAWREIVADLQVSFGGAGVHLASECDDFDQYVFSVTDLAKSQAEQLKDEIKAGHDEDVEIQRKMMTSMAEHLEKAAIILKQAIDI